MHETVPQINTIDVIRNELMAKAEDVKLEEGTPDLRQPYQTAMSLVRRFPIITAVHISRFATQYHDQCKNVLDKLGTPLTPSQTPPLQIG